MLKNKKVLLLLANGFEVLEASAFVDVFGWNNLEGEAGIDLFTCSFRREVKTAFGQNWQVDYLIEDISSSDFDALFIPGGFEEFGFYDDAFKNEFSSIIKSFHQQEKLIASVCVGALAIGKSGILKNISATTYQKNKQRINQLQSFEAIIKYDDVVVSKNIITSSGPSTALDVAFLCLEKLTNKENTQKVKALMGF